MSRRAKLGLVGAVLFSATGLVAVAALRDREPVASGEGGDAAPSAAAPAQAGGVTSVLCALRFELAVPYPHDWSAERAPVASGWLLALEVDPELARTRQVEEPVLQVGDTVAERIGGGDAGRLVAIVPSSAPLESAAIFFGAPALPERLDRTARLARRDAARGAGVRAFPAAALEAARDCGGGAVELAGRDELLAVAAQWILEYAPEERDLALDLLELSAGR